MNRNDFKNFFKTSEGLSWKDTLVHASRPVRIAATAALSLLALYLLVNTFQSFYTLIHSDDYSGATIVVTGEGTATAIPDTATVSFGDTATGADVATAQAAMTSTMNTAINAVEALGVSKDDVTTTSYNVSPHYSDPVCSPGGYCGSGVVSGYDVSEMVSVKIHDTAKVSGVLGALAKANITNVSGPDYVVGDTQMVMQQARAQAIQKAQADAQKLAAQLGEHLGRMSDFEDNTGGSTSPQPMVKMAGAMDAAVASAPSVPAGTNTYTDDVSITYYIK